MPDGKSEVAKMHAAVINLIYAISEDIRCSPNGYFEIKGLKVTESEVSIENIEYEFGRDVYTDETGE